MNSALNIRPPIISSGLTWRKFDPAFYIRSLGGTHPKNDWIPEASTGAGRTSGIRRAGRAGLNCCSGFKAAHRRTKVALGCQSIFSGGVPATMSSNHICYQVSFSKTFITNFNSLMVS